MRKSLVRKTTAFFVVALTTGAALVTNGCSTHSGPIDSASETRDRDLLPGVQIVYSANIDGEIEPCGCRSNPTGGLNRRWNLIEQKAPGERLSIDSGDLFYQSYPVPAFLEKQWSYQAETLAQAYNAFHLDVMTPGELDFAAGLKQLRRLEGMLDFPLVSANLYDKATGKRLFKPYVIVQRGGKKIGIFGIYDETLALPEGVEARDHVAAARDAVHELRGKADLLLALTHEGLDKDEALARSVSGIDAIFGSHSQSFLVTPEKIGDTLVFQPSFRGQHVGVYFRGVNSMYQVDTRFDSPVGKQNPMDKLLAKAKVEIGRINKQTEKELFAAPAPTEDGLVKKPEFQTFPRCAECHAPQYNFHKNTPHFRAFQTLVKAGQSANLECLKCHTVGAQMQGGWHHVDELVQNAAGKKVDAESFAKSLPNMTIPALTKTSKAFLNVQCENCHGAAGQHPFSGTYPKEVSSSTCLQCHTLDRAPGWYKGGKPDMTLIKTKMKSMGCPAS